MFCSMGDVMISVDGGHLRGVLHVPPEAEGIVLVAQVGDGSRAAAGCTDTAVAAFHEAGLGTLRVDLLMSDEQASHVGAEETEVLANRVLDLTSWLQSLSNLGMLPVGAFSAGVAGTALLAAAAREPEWFRALVCCDAPVDFARAPLSHVTVPTLLIAEQSGRGDAPAPSRSGSAELRTLAGLRESRAAAVQVARLAQRWFERHLPADIAETWDDQVYVSQP